MTGSAAGDVQRTPYPPGAGKTSQAPGVPAGSGDAGAGDSAGSTGSAGAARAADGVSSDATNATGTSNARRGRVRRMAISDPDGANVVPCPLDAQASGEVA